MNAWRLFTVMVIAALVLLALATYQVAWGAEAYPADARSAWVTQTLKLVPASSASIHFLYGATLYHTAEASLTCGPNNVATVNVTGTTMPRWAFTPLRYECVGRTVSMNAGAASVIYATSTPVAESGGTTNVEVTTDWEGWYWWLLFAAFFGTFWPLVFYFRRR